MKFYQKCQQLATPVIQNTNPDDFDYPDSIKTKVRTLVTNIKPKIGILDKINIPYIENAFDMKPDSLKENLDKSCGCIIPDGLINTLSTELFNKDFNTMIVSEQAIIKILSVYLMIQF